MSSVAQLISWGIGAQASAAYSLSFGLGVYGGTSTPVVTGFVYPTTALQCSLDDGASWTDLSADIRIDQEPIVIEYGITEDSPAFRIADTGQMSFALNNSASNSHGTVGLYSLLHASRRSGFDLNIPFRIALSCSAVDGGIPYYKFYGHLDDAPADPGAYLDRAVHCSVLDLMDDWANTDEPDLAVQESHSSDALLTTILAAIPSDLQPVSRTIQAGLETYPFSLDGASGQRLTIRERLNQIALSEFGRIFICGDTVTGGRLVFLNRHHDPLNTEVLFTLDNDQSLEEGVVVESSRRSVFRSVQVTVHPTNNVALEPVSVVYSLQSTQIYIGPGQTNADLFGPYLDEDTREQIGATDIQPLVFGTDYSFNVAQDGSGADISNYFFALPSTTGSGVRWTLANTGAIGGWVQTLQLRGRAIRRTDLLIETQVAGGYGRQVFTIDMPWQSSANVGSDVSNFLAGALATPSARLKSARFLANQSPDHMKAALKFEIGDRVSVTETVTGVSSEVVIHSVKLEIEQNGLLWCTWTFDPITATHYWLAGVVGFSEAGVSTVAGF